MTPEQQLAEAEKMASVCAESAKMWQEKADKLRARQAEKRGPFGISDNQFTLGRIVVRKMASGHWWAHLDVTQEIDGLEWALVETRDALSHVAGLVAVREATDGELWNEANSYATSNTPGNREARIARDAYIAGAARRSR